MTSFFPALRWRGPHLLWWAVFVVGLMPGCQFWNRPAALPKRSVMETEALHVLTDQRLKASDPLLAELELLQTEIAQTLDLPHQQQQVVIYLFGDQARYKKYFDFKYPNLPPRRAYFVGTSKELAVYTFWGDRIREDLRHEYTHGVLHASLKDVPLWLDEGLAEYFELTGPPGQVNREYSARTLANVKAGWQPSMARLESLQSVEQMQKGDYQEAWAWVHFLLHEGEASANVLKTYLHDLRTTPDPYPLSERVRRELPHAEERMVAYIRTLQTGSLASRP